MVSKKIKKLFDEKEEELKLAREAGVIRRMRKNFLDASYRRQNFPESRRNPLKWRREEAAKGKESLELLVKRLKAKEKEIG